MVYRIHGSHIGQQGLGSTYIGSRFFSFDMLLTGLQGHSEGPVTLSIHAHANDPTGYGSFEIVPGCKECGMWTAKTDRDAETLSGPDGDICTEFSGRSQQGEGQQIGCHYDKTSNKLHIPDERPVIGYISFRVWILNNGPKKCLVYPGLCIIARYDFNAQGFGSCGNHIAGLFEYGAVDKKFWNGDVLVIPVLLVKEHDHRFRSSCSFIKQGSVGKGKTGQITHHGLEVQEALQTALRNFSLVGRVLGIPSRIFKYIPENDAGCNRIKISLTNIIFKNQVLGCHFPDKVQIFSLTDGFCYQD